MDPSVFQLYSAVTNTHAKSAKQNNREKRDTMSAMMRGRMSERERVRVSARSSMSDESGAHEKMFEIARSDESKTIKRK